MTTETTMHEILQPTLNQFLVFVLVLTRLSGVMMSLPVFGSRNVPVRVRAFLAVGISVLVAPMFWGATLEHPGSLLNLMVLMGKEIVLGLSLGLGILIVLSGIQLTGQIIGQMSGMQLADAVNQNVDTNIPIFSQLLDMVVLVVFLSIGGHRQVMGAMLDTFTWMPPGHVVFSNDLVMALSDVVTQSFLLGIRAAAPMMIALLLSILIMGLISRTLPQLNIIAVGFSFNSIVMLATLSVSLGAVVLIFQEQAEDALHLITEAMMSGRVQE